METFTGKVLKGFYALEGIDGAGKTTLVNALKDKCRKEGVAEVLLCQAEPTNELAGIYCRGLIENVSPISLPPSMAAYLFAADRYNHLYAKNGGMLDLLNRGKMVLADRYLYSSIVYQTCMEDSRESMEQRRELAWRLNRDFEQPEKVFFLKCEPVLALERQMKRGKEPFDSLERLIQLDRQYELVLQFVESQEAVAGCSPSVVRLSARLDAETLAEQVYEEIFS